MNAIVKYRNKRCIVTIKNQFKKGSYTFYFKSGCE